MLKHFLLGQTARLPHKHSQELEARHEKREGTLATYLGARVIPFVSVLPPHPARSEPPTADPILEEDVTGTATPLSSKPCANPAKQQIRHQKLSLWKRTAALSANEPANRWRHVSSPSQNAPPHVFFPLLSLLILSSFGAFYLHKLSPLLPGPSRYCQTERV